MPYHARHRRTCTAVAAGASAVLLPAAALAGSNLLVANYEAHSITQFSASGVFRKTVVSTGPYTPYSLAVSPLSGRIFAATLTSKILRYAPSGAELPGGLTTSFDVIGLVSTNPVSFITFDSAGNLWLDTNFGTGGYQVQIWKFPAANLNAVNPAPAPGFPIVTTLGRGDQIAFDRLGGVCAASFLLPSDVQCYDLNTHALTYDYAAEFAGFLPTISPTGIAFDPNNRLYVSSQVAGQIVRETSSHTGPMLSVATGLGNYIGDLTADFGSNAIYVPSFHNGATRYNLCGLNYYACQDYDFSSDVIYRVDLGTLVKTTPVIDHAWGPYQMVIR